MPFTPFKKGGGKAAKDKKDTRGKGVEDPNANPFAKKSGKPKKTRRSPF